MAKNAERIQGKMLAKYQVAYLASEGLTQKRIASFLGLSQSTVSILLHEASFPEEGMQPLLDPRPRFLGGKRIKDSLQSSLFLGELQDQFYELGSLLNWKFAPKIYVGTSESINQNWDSRVIAWGRSVAPSLTELLRPCKTIGVSWGRQLRGLVEGIASLKIKRSSREQALVIATWPPRLSVRPESDDKMFKDHVALGSNSLAFDLSVALNGESSRNRVAQYFLPGIDLIPFSDPPFFIDEEKRPAALAKELEAEKRALDSFKASLFQIPSYQKIFGDHQNHPNNSLIRQLDAAIFPSGPAGGTRSFAMGGEYGGIPLEWFSKNTLGDIGGVIIPAKEADEMSPALRREFKRLKEHWLGIWEEDIAYIASNGKVGTIVGAVGDDRIEPILYGCKKQLIRHLFCDLSLAKGLSRAVRNEIAVLKKK